MSVSTSTNDAVLMQISDASSNFIPGDEVSHSMFSGGKRTALIVNTDISVRFFKGE